MQVPTIRTERLILRPFESADAPRVQQLAGAREVALNTMQIPHPYPDGVAEQWIAQQAENPDNYTFAIDDGQLAGGIGLRLTHEFDRAEVGYWLGVPFWGRGYTTEALGAVIRFGFEDLNLHRIYAGYFDRNKASGRVMEKNGLKYEGRLREHVKKWDVYVDVVYHGILREEWVSGLK